jgi:hypothetical protein
LLQKKLILWDSNSKKTARAAIQKHLNTTSSRSNTLEWFVSRLRLGKNELFGTTGSTLSLATWFTAYTTTSIVAGTASFSSPLMDSFLLLALLL